MGLGACSQREASIVDEAFKTPIKSAQVIAHMTLDGKPVIDLRGPMQTNGPGELESFDWRIKAMGGLEGRVISSGKNVFVTYKGVTYEVGADKIAKLQREQRSGDDVNSLQELQDRFGIDLKSWFPDTSTNEDAQAAGVPTTRVSGKLDVDRAVDDIAKMLKRPAVRAQLGAPKGVSAQALDQLKQAVGDARFSLDVGRDDHKLRQITVAVRIEDSGKAHRLGFLLEFRDVDKPVSIDAPSSGRPIEELLKKLDAGGEDLQKAA
jgi:hypothetical protein